jgi:hypothetical protein
MLMNKKTKLSIDFAKRLTPRSNEVEGRAPLIDEVKIGQEFFAVEAGRTFVNSGSDK